MPTHKSITLIGAGLAGSLLAIFLARRGLQVTVYERNPDMRRHETPAGRSINLALAHRGIRALHAVGLDEQVGKLLIPMRGRMLHDLDGTLSFAKYGRTPTEVIYSVSRPGLNRLLMNAAEAAGVQFVFEQRCEDLDFDTGALRLHDENKNRKYTVQAPRVIATDGGGSAVRQALTRRLGVKVVEDILPHGYKELAIPASQNGQHRMECEALHIWPRGGYMLIALPNLDGSFTATLFLANEGSPSFSMLKEPSALKRFFQENFADALELLPNLETEFYAHPTGLMGTVHCPRWHVEDKVLLLGDAAHAIVPFHGQGMNCAFEDCLILDQCIQKQGDDWATVFTEFEQQRRPDAEAIAAMALENYVEMRDVVRDPKFHLQKQLGFLLEERHPGVFVPRYSMVMFHHLPYSEARRRGAIQQTILDELTRNAHSLEQINLERADTLIAQKLGDTRIEA
ncbi:MAG TPA: NAD(P)/FAD-dependent oxidoreductase [Gammaproteobacteria bacterium]|nr:NAD(P)/FAD-dependent oxidoreductase [Gammaproteobacteria bacterium]